MNIRSSLSSVAYETREIWAIFEPNILPSPRLIRAGTPGYANLRCSHNICSKDVCISFCFVFSSKRLSFRWQEVYFYTVSSLFSPIAWRHYGIRLTSISFKEEIFWQKKIKCVQYVSKKSSCSTFTGVNFVCAIHVCEEK